MLRHVVVNFRDDVTPRVRGVLWSVRGRWLVFKHASALEVGEAPSPLHDPEIKISPIDGDVVIDRAHVAYLQVLP